ADAGEDLGRARTLETIARADTDPAHRKIALLTAARLYEREIQDEAALSAYREVLALEPGNVYARDAVADLLRSHQRWPELVDVRVAEARACPDAASARAGLREAAWVLEICLDDPSRAATVYDDWLTRLPDDRAALGGA